MNNNILRTEKVKSRAQITQAAEHNFRIRSQSNIDDSRTKLNKIFVNTLGVDTKKASDLQEKLSEFYSGLGIKEKANNVLMMEFVVSASPEFFSGKKISEINEWANHQVEFFKNEFGDQVKIAVLHLDEKTPHLHFMIGTEIKSVKKYKNQKGEFFKETWSLKADRYNPEFLTGLHDRHAQWNKKYGLKRGVKGSMRQHKSLKEFYKMVDKAMSADYESQIEKVIQSMDAGMFSGKVSIEEVREKFAPLVNKTLKQNKALREKYKLELKEWAIALAEREKELDTALADTQSRKELYIEAINEKAHDAALLREQESEIQKLKRQLAKYEKVPAVNNSPFASIKNKGNKL